MNRETRFWNVAGKRAEIFAAAAIAVFAALFCVGCGNNSTGSNGGKKDTDPAYIITFNPTGGSVTPQNGATNANGTLASLPIPTRNGYTFDGWFTAETDGEAVTENTVFSNDATIYAQWKLNIYKITFDANGGTVTSESDTTGAGWKLDSLPTPTRDGYTFSGWYTAATGGAAVTKDSAFSNTTTIYARWTLKTYKITFDANGGTVTPTSDTTGADWKLASLPTATRNGYSFNGWYTMDTGGTVITKDTAFSNDTTIYAQWTLRTYTITFNANGGTVNTESDKTSAGWKLESLPTPTRNGYTFDGWFTAETDGEAVTENTVFSNDAAIYAQWTIITYTITFNANGGTVDPTTATTGDGWKLASLPTPTQTGYTFNGWFTAETDGAVITKDTTFSKDTTLYAHWTLNIYAVTFNSQGGSAVSSQNIEHGGKAAAPDDPTRTGYTFDGWYRETAYTTLWNFDADIVTSAVTLYAKWTLNIYTITFDANGGTVDPTTATTGDGWKLASLPTPTKADYTFNGWYTAATGGTVITKDAIFSKDTTLYAQWTLNVYAVTFNSQSGTNVNLQNIEHGGKAAKPADPTHTGYTFDGWYREDTYTTPWDFDTDVVTSAITLYAKWTLNIYTITFDANGGTLSTENGTTGNGWKLTSLPTPTRNDYKFIGWFTAETGGTVVTISRVYSADETIYAQWTPGVTDSRDGKVYKKVTIGTQTWMAENLDYGVEGSRCYDDNADSCVKYGRLYNWATAMGGASSSSASSSGVQGVCPVGWHLPSDAEWTTLTDYVGGSSTAGTKLKSPQYWQSYSGVPAGTDDFGFSALPGGRGYSGYFNDAGGYGVWWSATESDAGGAWDRYMYYSREYVDRNDYAKAYLFAVRCVQD